MRLQLKSIGSGTTDDPYRVALPTYRLLSHDEKTKIAVVEVPEFVHPFTAKELADMPKKDHAAHGSIHVPTAAHIKTLHAHFDEQYQEHKGEFRLELA